MELQHKIAGDSMTYHNKSILLYPNASTSSINWSTTPETITDAFNVRASIGVAERKDIFSFSLVNASSKYSSKFKIGDNLKFYFGQNGSTSFVLDGIISKVGEDVSDSGKIISVSGKSRTEYLLEALIPLSAQSKTPPQIARQIIDFINNKLPTSLKFTYDDTSIPLTRSNGDAHNTFTMEERYKQAYMLLERISSNQYTGEGNYIFYIDNNNKFYFKYRTSTSSATLSEGTLINSLNVVKDNEEVINWVYFVAGFGPDGVGINGFVSDDVSRQKNGWKPKWISETSNIAHDLMGAEVSNNPSYFDNANGWYPNAYNYTTFWKSRRTSTSAPACTINQNVVIHDDGEYVDAVAREAQWQGEDKANAFMKGFVLGKYKVQYEIPRSVAYNVANLVTNNIPSFSYSGKTMRLVSINFDDYSSTLELEEDIGTV